jgi:UDP-N-acetyl-alpha-D-muramoyl-L-alanyl-L-glutamate epimerase
MQESLIGNNTIFTPMPLETFDTFYIEHVTFNKETLLCTLYYSFDKKVFFTEEIHFASEWFEIRKDIQKEIVENMSFHILIAFWISYYKLNPTKKVIIESWYLDEKQLLFWRKFYINGLGEFFYKNDIDFTSLCFFESSWEKIYSQENISLQERYLVPIGWGKDSIVTTILFDQEGKNKHITPFIFWKSDTIKNDFLEIYEKKALLIKRKLSPLLFDMNEAGYFNGHVPITGLISFVLVLASYLYDYKHIVFSNEKSANIGNTEFYGNMINHQYSKSEEFEKDFRNYIQNYISPDINYFSKLRNFSELEIARIFSEKGKKYFTTFSSCNANFKINWKPQNTRWCNHCPKCLFVYTIMRPFITNEEVKNIWWEELFEKKELETLFKEIIGVSGFKPFECVGEIEEAILASQISQEKFKKIPYLLQILENESIHKNTNMIKEKYLKI